MLTLGDNFSYQGAKPLDARLKYDTTAAMKAVADATMYEGCMAYCVATDKTYQWKSKNSIDESTGKWREYTSGGGEATDYSELTGKPSIEGVELDGAMTADDLGLAKETDIPTKVSDLDNDENFVSESDVHNIPDGGTTGQVLKKVSNTDYDVEWSDDGGGESSIVNGYAYATPIDYTSPMALINWVKAHTDKTITVPDESIFSGRNSKAFYIVLSENSGYYLFSQYPFTLKTHWLTRNSVKIFNSSRYTQDGVNHTGYNSGSAFTYANGIRYCNEVTIKGSSEVDLDYLADTEKTAQIFYTPDVNFDASYNAYSDNETLIENKIKFYTDAQHTTEITPVENKIYVDIPTGKMYEWNGTEYTLVGGGDVPTKTSDLDNDSGFITKDVNNLTNYPTKTEVNTSLSGKQDTIQLSTMPTASAEYADKIVQFMGATTSTYVHGYFYECRVSNDTYSWVQTDVQPSGGAGGGHTIEDSEGTSLTQRDTMQFGDGFNASDDSTNEKTVVEPNLMTTEDMNDVVTPLPSVQSRYHKYSTEEQIVGEWIDGKPLYQKSFHLTNITFPSQKTYSDFTLISDSTFLLCSVSGIVKTTTDTLMIPTVLFDRDNGAIYLSYEVKQSSEGNIFLRLMNHNGSMTTTDAYVTIQYTKTTD